MPRRIWRSLDGPYVTPRPGDTVDLRGTTKALAVEERKEILLSNYYSGIGSYFGGYSSVTTAPGRPWTIDRGVREGYGRIPWVHSAVRVIATSQAGLRFGTKDKALPIGEGAVELKDDPLLPLLNVRANPVEFAVQFRKRVSMQWMLSPRGGFIEKVPPKNASRSKRVVEVRLLPPGRTRIIPDNDGNIDHYEVDPVGGIGKPRTVDADKVMWFREEHPTDPFAGLTPLEAAGLSIEMDYFARLFNRQFMANDGRPGGIVAVSSPDGKGEPADDAELDRVERKFGGGPVDAGRLVVLDGTVTYQDVTKSARDLQWKDATVQARNEIFAVFLVPVSAVDSSDRTFSNAGQEWINYWTLMGVPHGDAFAMLFSDTAEGIPFLDYSKVAALEELKKDQRAEWRDEVNEGLRTPLRYAKDTGQTIGDQPGDFPDVPATRSLWLPAGKVPVALNDQDQEDVEKLAPLGSGTQAAPMRAGAAGGGIDGGEGDTSGGDGGGGIDGGGGDGGGGGWPDQGGGAGGGDAQFKDVTRGQNVARLEQRRAARARRTRAVAAGGRPMHDDESKEDDQARPVEAALATALTAMAQRQVGVALARARGTKARMGTRHWAPKPGEAWSTKQLDPNDVVDPQQWNDQATAIAQQNLHPLAQQVWTATRDYVIADAAGDAAVAAAVGPLAAGAAALNLAGELAQVVTWLATSAANHGAELLEVVAQAERDDAARVAGGGAPAGIQPVVDAIAKWAQGIGGWVAQVVPTSVAQAVEAGKHAVLGTLGGRVEREWRTKLDDRVRDAHKDAEGQVAAGGDPFLVGGEQLRYPRDPLGSPGNVINCRCRTRWRLATGTEGKALEIAGGNVVADVLALPTPSVARHASRHAAGLEAVAGRGEVYQGAGLSGTRGRADRVEPTAALAGVAGRDHVAEILGLAGSGAKDIVRTAAGEHEYHLPIGSPIGHGGGDWQAHRILKVHDSRDLVEQGDKFVRVPGTGDLRQCDRCGKGHEVHVTVEDQHGAQHTVGTACARATGPAASKLKSVTSATATADKLEAQAAKAETYQAQRRAALEQVRATMQMPAHTEAPSKLGGTGTDFTLPNGEGYQRVGNTANHVPTDKEREYALRQLREQWEQRRVDEVVPRVRNLDYADVEEMKRKAAKARKKANDLLDQPTTGTKARHVRTSSGVEEFHLPIGSLIGGQHHDAPHVQPHTPNRDDVDNLFTGEFAGFRTTVDGLYLKDDGSISISGTIHAGTNGPYHPDDDVGEFRRVFHPEDGAVEHQLLKLDDEVQGLGFATAFNAHAEKQYASWGYRQINVEAGDQAGGVVWAKAGYLFDEGRPPEDVTDALEYAQMSGTHGAWDPVTGGTQHLKMDAAESKAVTTLVARARGDNEVTPAEVIAAGPIATAIMREYGWNGYKPIDGTKAAQGDVMRVRVRGVRPLAGIDGRDHVAEMLAPQADESKVRRVRTAGGSRRFHEPIGSPIVAHPGLGGLGGRDHAGDVAADAARTTAARRELTDRMAAARGRAYGLPSPAPMEKAKTTPTSAQITEAHQRVQARLDESGNDHHSSHSFEPEDLHGALAEDSGKWVMLKPPSGTEVNLPRGDVETLLRAHGYEPPTVQTEAGQVAEQNAAHAAAASANTDMAKAKQELVDKKQTVLDLIDGGKSPADAEKEYARLLHNARFRYRRERLKAEKAAGGKVAKAVDADAKQGPKKVTLGGIGQQLLDDPAGVQLDKALKDEAGAQPKALYSAEVYDKSAGPGGVRPNEKWYDKLTADTAEPIPVSGLHIESGYTVKHGVAVRKNGVGYLVETAGPEPTADELARLQNAQTVYANVLGTIPGDRARMQRGVALVTGANPRDDYWAQQYKTPGFKSAATGGGGGATYWGTAVNPSTAAHEYGHNLDSGVHLPGKWLSDSGVVLEGQQQAYGPATYDDRSTGHVFAAGGALYGKFHETRPGGHPVTPGKNAPTSYGTNSIHEDFAESVRLYLKDRREGKLGYLSPEPGQSLGTNVRFADLWPARAKALDTAFGVTSDYETPYVKAQQSKAVAAIAARRIEIHEATQEQGAIPEGIGLVDAMQKFGLSMPAAAAAWEQADAQFKNHLAAKNQADALEHVKDEWGGLGEVPDAGTRGEMEATLVDGFGLTPKTARAIIDDAVAWKQGQLEAVALQKQQGEAKLAAEAAVQDVLSLADLPKELQTVIRKRRANVKLRAKQKGASPEQAEAIAAAYESEQVAKEAKKLGLEGQVGMTSITPKKVAAHVGGKAPKATKPKKGDASDGDLLITTKWGNGSTGAKSFLTKAGKDKSPDAKNATGGAYYGWGAPQQAKANIAGNLARRLNNEQDWEVFRAYRNSGAHQGATGTAFMPPPPGEQIKPFASYTAEQRQSILDTEVSARVQMWASTSGDSNPYAVMMQQAVKDELGVPGVVGVNDGGHAAGSVKARYPHVADFYRRFVRVQYEHTQEELTAAGIEWIPLYRGMKVPKGAHAWADNADDVHVPLQPASSFSTAPSVARRFSGYGNTAMMTRVMVHRSMILGSARTGFGCLNEKEFAVLAPTEDEAKFSVRYGSASSSAGWDALFAVKAADFPKGDPPWGTSQDLEVWSVATLQKWWHAVGGPDNVAWRVLIEKELKRRGIDPPDA